MKKLNKVICLSLSAMMLAAAISGCGAKETTDAVQNETTGEAAPAGEMSRDNTMIYGAEFMVEKFNPILGSEYCDAMIFRGLMKTDVDCQPQCDIATDYEISDDLLTYTFNIRDDVKFHDGTTLTADDVVFTISSILDENVNSSIRSDFLLVDKVEKLSDTSLSITLKDPFPALLDKLTVGIVPEHCFEGQDINTADFNANPVGCGPYKLVSLEAGTKCTMTRFDDYYGDKAQIENIIYLYLPDYNTRALQLKNNEIDFTFVEPSQIEELEAAQVSRVKDEVAFVVLNGNYALQAGYSVSNDSIAHETSDSEAAKTYVNVIAVKEGNEDSEAIKALVDTLKSDEIKDFINEKYDGAVVPFEDSADDTEEAADEAKDETADADAETTEAAAEEAE